MSRKTWPHQNSRNIRFQKNWDVYRQFDWLWCGVGSSFPGKKGFEISSIIRWGFHLIWMRDLGNFLSCTRRKESFETESAISEPMLKKIPFAEIKTLNDPSRTTRDEACLRNNTTYQKLEDFEKQTLCLLRKNKILLLYYYCNVISNTSVRIWVISFGQCVVLSISFWSYDGWTRCWLVPSWMPS